MTLVFDLDDTLYPEREFVRGGLQAVDRWLCTERGVAGFLDAAWTVFEEGMRGRIFDVALQRLGVFVETALIEAMVGVYRLHSPQISLHPDAARALERHRGHDRIGLLTDGHAAVQRNKIAALRLGAVCDAIVCTDEIGPRAWKPAPDGFERIMVRFGGAGCEYVYVGDNPAKDFVAPNRLGWLTLRIVRPGAEHARVDASRFPSDHAAHRAIGSLDELPDLLQEWHDNVSR